MRSCTGMGSVVSDSLRPRGLQPARLLCPWNFAGKNIGAGCYFLLQGIFPTQGINLHLFHLLVWQADSSPLCHLGSYYVPGSSHPWALTILELTNSLEDT